ncbi:MAG: immunoglobulin domain-containing protein [Bacilli bacterium]|jgi:hypothetical protein
MNYCNKRRVSLDMTERLLKVGAKISSKLISTLQEPLGFDADIFYPVGEGVYGGSDNSVKYDVLPTLSRRVLISNLITERFLADKTLDVFNELQPAMWIEPETKIPRYSKVIVKLASGRVIQLKVQYESGMLGIDQEMFHKYPLIPMSAVITGTPEILEHPQDTVLDLGGTGTLSVLARGGGTLSYQWYKGDTKITGADEAILTFDTVSEDDVGYYRVVITNEIGTATSYKAYVTVASLPFVLVNPVGGTFNVGSRCTMTVLGDGTPPIKYQWYKDDVILEGKTGKTLSISSVSSSNAGEYKVSITNLSGSIFSDSAIIMVN